jgi:hypothetical protein
MENNPYPQTTTATPKTSGLAIASLVCGIFGLLLLPGLLGVILGIIAISRINSSNGAIKGKGLAIGGLVLSLITSLSAGVILLVASLMLPALAKAKANANRMKCLNNLKQISSAHIYFSAENDGFPWQLPPPAKQQLFGSSRGMDKSVGGIFGLEAMKMELVTPKILHSPCDPGRASANEELQMLWQSYNTKDGNPMPAEGISYVLCEGADDLLSDTVLSLTRNLSTDNLTDATWLGADNDSSHPNTMEGLNANQGQLVLTDGSARRSTNFDLGEQGMIVGDHINSRGGRSPGNPSTQIFR